MCRYVVSLCDHQRVLTKTYMAWHAKHGEASWNAAFTHANLVFAEGALGGGE